MLLKMQAGNESQIQKILACYKCGKAFPHVEGIANHLKLIHNACITPDCKNIPDLNLHCLTCPNRRLSCIVCHKTFKDKNIFLTHFNQHIDVALFICEICREGFQLRKLLYKHVCEVHENSALLPEIPARSKALYQKCPNCTKYFKLLSEFEEHKSLCNSTKLICHICEVNFLTSELLEGHRQVEHHSRQPVKGHKALKEGKRYFCGLCYLGFFAGSILRLHLDTHNTSSEFKCDVCYSCFSSDDDLQEHYLLHIEEHYILQDVIQQYSCTYCKRTFKNQLLLQNHIKFDVCQQNGQADPRFSGTAKTTENQEANAENGTEIPGPEIDASDIPVYIYKSGDELLNCDDNNCVIVIDHKSVFVFQRGMCASEDRMPDLSNSEAYKEDDDIDASLLNNHMLQVLYPPTADNGDIVSSEVASVPEAEPEIAKDANMDAGGGESVDNDMMLQEIYDAVLRA